MQDFNKQLSSMISSIDAIYISNSFFEMMNEQSCDCDEIVIKCGDKCILLTSEAVGENGRIVFNEAASFDETRYPYEIKLEGVQFVFDKSRYLENGMIEGVRFVADGVFLFIFASEHNLILTMSKYDLFDETEMDFSEKEAMLTIVKRNMANLFCDEPILAVYEGSNKYDYVDGTNAYFDVFHDIAYHVTEGYRIVLETENFYISLGHDGVIKTKKECSIEEFAQKDEWLDSCIHDLGEGESPWVDYESTLFVGERLLDVQHVNNCYFLTFDDFQMKLVPYKLHDDNFPPSLRNENHWSYNHVLGAERYLTAKCHCGGAGELLLDFVSDFVVRCKKCKNSTYAEMIAENAIKEWNEGHIQCDLSDITIE